MANALNIWNEETQAYEGLPILKGEKGDRGDKGDNGKDYVLTQSDKDEIAETVKNELTFPTASETEKGCIRVGDGLKMDGDILNVNHKIISKQCTNLYPDKISILINNVIKVGQLCYVCVQFIVNETFSISSGNIAVFELPFRPAHRVWYNYESSFWTGENKNKIQVNGSTCAAGNKAIQAVFIVKE